ncbi:sodium-dependent transporter [bacterium]|nr:sodium-dependent transporter [bacterium]
MADQQFHSHDQPYPIDQSSVRGKFASNIGFLLAAVGSAIGLGNIWKFPYIMGENGGAAFMLVYLACIILVGTPVLIAEFAVGRQGKTSAVSCYKVIAPGTPWWLNGLLGVLAGFVILSFYSAVAGWVLKYFMIGVFEGYGAYNAETSGGLFVGLITGFDQPLIYQFIIMALTALIIYFGIEKGVERAAKILMPLLFAILALLLIRSLTLKGGMAGVEFMFKPDFTKLSGKGVLEALGHAFFTLSVGMGAMMTYASYLDGKSNLATVGATVATLDTVIAIMAGLVIFPAVFAFNMDPGQGPALIFITLPQVFAEMPLGRLVGSSFFFLIFVAALTSTISILEPVVTWLVDDVKVNRHVSTAIASFLIFLVGIPACLSVAEGGALDRVLFTLAEGTYAEKQYRFFDILDDASSKFMLPIGGFILCLFLLISWKRQSALQQVAGEKGNPRSIILNVWYWLAVTVAPLGILTVIIFGILDLIGKSPFH